MEEDLCGLDRDPGAGIIRLLAELQEKPDAMVKLAEKTTLNWRVEYGWAIGILKFEETICLGLTLPLPE